MSIGRKHFYILLFTLHTQPIHTYTIHNIIATTQATIAHSVGGPLKFRKHCQFNYRVHWQYPAFIHWYIWYVGYAAAVRLFVWAAFVTWGLANISIIASTEGYRVYRASVPVASPLTVATDVAYLCVCVCVCVCV